MIFITVGDMDPFDRMIKTIDLWLAEHPTSEKVIAQIGAGIYQPKHCDFVPFLTPNEFHKTFEQARVVISHAGTGTIITALVMSKPIVVFPKRASLGEQRIDHQLAVVRPFHRSQSIVFAEAEVELSRVLDRVFNPDGNENFAVNDVASWPVDESLIQFVEGFVS